jgi:hypothetical protein
VKKGRHRRFEEARALKRSSDINIEDIFESLQAERPEGTAAEDHPEWSDLDDDDDA